MIFFVTRVFFENRYSYRTFVQIILRQIQGLPAHSFIIHYRAKTYLFLYSLYKRSTYSPFLLHVKRVYVISTIIHCLMLHINIGLPHRKHLYQLMANELKIPHVAVSFVYILIVANFGILKIPRNSHWMVGSWHKNNKSAYALILFVICWDWRNSPFILKIFRV